MIQTFLLASLPPSGEGALGPTGQARAPDGWESEFANVLLNFLFEQDGENQESLAGAASVFPLGLPVSLDAAFPVIETPESQAVLMDAAETGPQPGGVVTGGSTTAFVLPANSDPTVEAGAQTPADAVAAVDTAADEAAATVSTGGQTVAPSIEEANQAIDVGAGAVSFTGSVEVVKAQPVQTPASEQAAVAEVRVEQTEQTVVAEAHAKQAEQTVVTEAHAKQPAQPAPEGKSELPVEMNTVGLPAEADTTTAPSNANKTGRSEVKPSDGHPRVPVPAVESGSKLVGEPAPEEGTVQPAAQTAESPLPKANAQSAEVAAVRTDPVPEPARSVEQVMSASVQPQPSPNEPLAVNQRTIQTVEAKDQGVMMQMVQTIQTSVQHGQSSLRMQLNPQELGSIDVRLVSNPQGIGVTVFADQASTGRLLEMQIDQLRASLQDAGVQISHLNVFQQSQQRHEGPADWNRKLYSRRQPSFARQDQQSAEAVEGSRLTQSMVDYRV